MITTYFDEQSATPHPVLAALRTHFSSTSSPLRNIKVHTPLANPYAWAFEIVHGVGHGSHVAALLSIQIKRARKPEEKRGRRKEMQHTLLAPLIPQTIPGSPAPAPSSRTSFPLTSLSAFSCR